MSQQVRTTQQDEIVRALVERFNIDGSKVIFFKEDPLKPWLRAATAVANPAGPPPTTNTSHDF